MQNINLKEYKIPDKPGVYFFIKDKEILYIGKATSLKDRVKSYFGKDLFNTRGPLLVDMITKSTTLKWVVADSVLEALILEANLIKKHQPIYNTKEKSDKSFNYVCITKEDLPKVIIVRGKVLPYRTLLLGIYGPYPNGSQLREALKIIRRIFPFLDDKSKNNYEFYKQLNLAPDVNPSKAWTFSEVQALLGFEQYKKNIKNIKLFFEGKKKTILSSLEKEMKVYAKRHEFEKAGEIKRQIFALQHIQDVALIKNDPLSFQERVGVRLFRIEAYDIAHMSGKDMVGVMVVIEDGEPNKSEYRKFKIKNYSSSNDTGALLEVLTRRLNHKEWRIPDLIVVDGGVAQRNVALKILKKFKLNIPVSAVVKNQRHKPKAILSSSRSDLGLPKGPTFSRLVLLANAEAHRFAIAYHRKLRGKIV